MSRRYSTANAHEAEAAIALLRSQGYPAHGEINGHSVVVLERDSVEAVELLLRRAPSARRLS